MSNMEICAALEEAGIALHRIENLLQIYEEHIEEELHYLHEYESCCVTGHFIARYDMLRSLLETIQLHAHRASDSVRKKVAEVTAAKRAEKDSAA